MSPALKSLVVMMCQPNSLLSLSLRQPASELKTQLEKVPDISFVFLKYFHCSFAVIFALRNILPIEGCSSNLKKQVKLLQNISADDILTKKMKFSCCVAIWNDLRPGEAQRYVCLTC
jgi:hypothetical protein